MEEDEIVISSRASRQRSDFQKDLNEATERRSNNELSEKVSKENVDLNSWLDSRKDNKDTKVHDGRDSEDDEVTLDDDTLSRLIEGDLKNEEDSLALSRPKPKPRHKEFSSNDRDGPAGKLFSGKNEKSYEQHNEKSPHPVPRRRAKPNLKENLSGSFSDKNNLGSSGDSRKLSADKLFDSVGKGNKTVSFQDLSGKQDVHTLPKGERKDSVSGFHDDSGKKRSSESDGKKPKSSPTKPVRTTGKSAGVNKVHGDKPETVDLQGNSNAPEHRSRPPLLHSNDNFKQYNSNASVNQHAGKESFERHNGPSHGQRVSERELNSNGYNINRNSRESFGVQDASRRMNMIRNNSEDFDVLASEKDQRFVERMQGYSGDNVISQTGVLSQKQIMGKGENIAARHLNKQNFERSEHGRLMMNSRYSPRSHRDLESSQKEFSKEQDFTRQMFEEHVPNTESVLGQNEQRTRNQRGRIQGQSKQNTPLKAEKNLDEMTKSPELYNFNYESRDTPQSLKFSSGRNGAKRSSSLTNLDDWQNTEFEEDKDVEGLDSWRSDFTSSTSIRQAVFNEWLERKQKGLKEKSREKITEKIKEEEKLKEKNERQLSAKKAFDAWNSSKVGAIKGKVKKKKELQDMETDAKREKMVKLQDAKKFFQSWKSKKDEVLKESYKEKKTNEKEAKHKEIEEKQEKIDIAKKSYDKWKARKDAEITEELKSKRRAELLKTKYEKEAETEKRRESERTFQEFMKTKGTWKRPPPSPTLTQRAWCPGGLTKGANLIPTKIQPVVPTPRLNRSHSFSGRTRELRRELR